MGNKSLVVNAHDLICVLNQLIKGECAVAERAFSLQGPIKRYSGLQTQVWVCKASNCIGTNIKPDYRE